MCPGHGDAAGGPGAHGAVVAAAARTDVGRVRPQNEDAALLRPEEGLFAVADGMGGHAAGEVASALAVETVAERLGGAAGAEDRGGGVLAADSGSAEGRGRISADAGGPRGGREAAGSAVREAVAAANARIHRRARENPEQRGMGTTATVLLVADAGRWTVGHVGDSRAYLLRGGELSRVTTDHTLVPGSSTLTRALGTREDVDVDVLGGELTPGDVFLLSSDGLTDLVSDDEIRAALAAAAPAGSGVSPGERGGDHGRGTGGPETPGEGGPEPGRAGGREDRLAGVRRAAGALVEKVLERGARDNVTVVVVGLSQ